MLHTICLLLILFQLKHLLADYPLQTKYMLGKFKPGWDFVWPLVAHCSVHAIFTFLICLYFSPKLWWLCLLDFIAHFTMDRIKAGPKWLGRFKPLTAKDFIKHIENIKYGNAGQQVDSKKAIKGNTFFWWSLGLDQMVHHITHYIIIYLIIILK